jgi:hypothetical protein
MMEYWENKPGKMRKSGPDNGMMEYWNGGTLERAAATLALRGEEAVWDMHSELRGDFKPHSPPGQGWQGGRGYPADDAVDSWKDEAGI